MKLQKILVPLDFSHYSKEALHYALMLQEKYQAKLILLHVLSKAFETYPMGDMRSESDRFIVSPSGGLLLYSHQGGKEVRRDLLEEARWKMKDLIPVAHQEYVQIEVQVGDPSAQILITAREEKVDLIIMGTHGRTGLSHLLMGSVAARVVRQSKIPVLTIRPTAKAN